MRCFSNSIIKDTIVAGICLWGIWESILGLLQTFGWRSSRHALFALTGHFQNPGPFGGFIACVMAAAVAWLMGFPVKPGMTENGRWMAKIELGIRVLAWTALAAGILVLPASMSRAGWLGLVVALGIESLRQARVRGWMHAHRWAVPATVIASMMFLAGAFFLKPDSALGRLHVWRMECRAIAERPWRGAGAGMGPWAYGEAQEAFFREHLETASPATVRVAGCPDHAYNEYLGLGVEYGLPAMLLFISLMISSIAVLHKARSPLAAGLTAWAVFACASYPLAVPQLRILGSVFIVAAVIAGVLQTGGSCRRRAALLPLVSAVALTLWIKIPGQARNDEAEEVRSVYAEGYALHQAGRYEDSTKVLERGALMSCDPMFEVIIGKNAEALGDFDRAQELYEKAHYMVPSRLYPLARLMRLQIRQGGMWKHWRRPGRLCRCR